MGKRRLTHARKACSSPDCREDQKVRGENVSPAQSRKWVPPCPIARSRARYPRSTLLICTKAAKQQQGHQRDEPERRRGLRGRRQPTTNTLPRNFSMHLPQTDTSEGSLYEAFEKHEHHQAHRIPTRGTTKNPPAGPSFQELGYSAKRHVFGQPLLALHEMFQDTPFSGPALFLFRINRALKSQSSGGGISCCTRLPSGGRKLPPGGGASRMGRTL